jgi:hypothetical protein
VKVRFEYPAPVGTHPYEQRAAAKYLTLGSVYTVSRQRTMRPDYTDFFLEEIPNIGFNSAHFVEVP